MPLIRKGGVLTTLAKAVKQDPIGGSILIDEVVYSYLADEAERLRPDIERVIAAYVGERTAIAKSALDRTDIDKEVLAQTSEWLDGIDAYARAVANKYSVNKSTDLEDWFINGRRVRRQVNRDARGRFAAKIDISRRRDPLSSRQTSPRLMGSQVITENGQKKYSEAAQGNAQRLEQHQGQWEQANEAVQALYRSFGLDRKGVNVDVYITDDQGGLRTETFDLNNGRRGLPDLNIDPLHDDIRQIELSTEDPNKVERVAQFNALGEVGGMALARFATVPSNTYTQAFGRYDINQPQNQSKLTQFFNRLSAGSDILNAVPGAEKLAATASLVGTMGPEAEKVLSPYVQQAAYRYRGTEKEPDLELVRAFNSNSMNAVHAAAAAGAGSSEARTLASAGTDEKGRNRETDIVLGSAEHRIAQAVRNGRPYTEDELKMQVHSDVAARYLMNTLPDDPFVAEVSRKAGDVLPSQGVLIDADGDVVSQAVGFSDDHYLPFDLKNLAALRGGQYVRTRVEGGLTAEDIYASVAMGSRMSTVVSSSGVFSIEFDPSFRGGRANSDKARQMYDRYVKILDAVDGSGLYAQDLPPAVKERISRQARQMSTSEDDFKEIRDSMLEAERRNQMSLSEEDVAALQEEAEAEARQMGTRSPQQLARLTEEIFNEKLNDAQESKVQRLRLNSEGYKVALETLQQQFPYFIRSVSYEPLGGKKGGFLNSRNQDARGGVRQRSGKTDQGYVGPGGLRANSVQSGYYKPAGPMGSKSGRNASTEVSEGEGSSAPAEDKPADGAAPKVQSAPKGNGKDVVSRVQTMEPLIARRRQDAVRQFVNFLPEMGIDVADYGANNWDAVRGKAGAIKHIAGLTADEYEQLLAADPEGVVESLSNEKAVANFFQQAMASDGGTGLDFFQSLAEQGRDFYGAKSVDEAAALFSRMAQEIVDLSSLTNPYSELRGNDASAAFNDAERPQGFQDILAIDNAGKLQAFKDNNPDIAAMAEQLGRNGNRYLSMGQTAANARQLIAGLQKVAGAQSAVMDYMRQTGDYNPMAAIKPALGSMGTTPEEIEAVIGHPIKDGSDLAAASQQAQAQALKVQRAWSLVTAERLLNVLGAGDADPKVGDAVLAKSQTARSSRRVVTLSKSHPLAVEIQMRKSLGLPLV